MSARRNAFALSTELPGPVLLKALNSISPELYFTAATPVSNEFRPRGASRRIYRYFEPTVPADRVRKWEAAASVLSGDVDVRSFGRAISGDRPVWRTIDALAIMPRRRGLIVEVRARSFVWGMVRKLVGALREHAAGRLTIDRLAAAVRGEVRLSLPMAEPEGLVLWDVQYPLRWPVRWAGPSRHQQAHARVVGDALHVRAEVLRALGMARGREGASTRRTATRRVPTVPASERS